MDIFHICTAFSHSDLHATILSKAGLEQTHYTNTLNRMYYTKIQKEEWHLILSSGSHMLEKKILPLVISGLFLKIFFYRDWTQKLQRLLD